MQCISLKNFYFLQTKLELHPDVLGDDNYVMPKLSDQVSVRISPEWRETLRIIEEKHRIPPPEFIRGMVAAGLEFYRLHGWFAFPINVQPGPEYVQAVAETQSRYDASPKPKKTAK
jgi:hypothetical protein